MSHDETPILLNGQVPDEPARLRKGDGPKGYQAAHIGTEPPGAMPDTA